MKNKMTRVLGIVMTVALLASMLVSTAPVSAGTQAWSKVATPSATGLVLDSGNTFTDLMVWNMDGTAIYASSNVGGVANMVKSTDGGRTWTKLSGLTAMIGLNGGPGVITDITPSSVDANTVYATDGFDIFKSIDGGSTWVTLSNLFNNLSLATALAADTFTMTATGVGADSFTMTATGVGADSFTMTATTAGTVTVVATSGSVSMAVTTEVGGTATTIVGGLITFGDVGDVVTVTATATGTAGTITAGTGASTDAVANDTDGDATVVSQTSFSLPDNAGTVTVVATSGSVSMAVTTEVGGTATTIVGGLITFGDVGDVVTVTATAAGTAGTITPVGGTSTDAVANDTDGDATVVSQTSFSLPDSAGSVVVAATSGSISLAVTTEVGGTATTIVGGTVTFGDVGDVVTVTATTAGTVGTITPAGGTSTDAVGTDTDSDATVVSQTSFNLPDAAGILTITSMDVGFISTNPYIFVGTSSFGNAGGDVYVAQEAVFGMPWTDMNVATDRVAAWDGADINKVIVDPVNFGTSQMVMAIGTADTVVGGGFTTNAAIVTTKYGGQQWAATVADSTLYAATVALQSATCWLPEDFSASLASGTMQAFFGTTPLTPAAGEGDVYWTVFGPVTSPAFDLNAGGVATDTHITSLDGIGTTASASLVASGYASTATTVTFVASTTNSGGNWVAATKLPSGGVSPLTGTAYSSVLVNPVTGDVLIATSGADCGVSISHDWGFTWNTISLINTTIGTINDLAIGDTTYMSTSVGAANTASSIWKLTGTTWERILSDTLYAGLGVTFDFNVLEVADGAIFTCELNTVVGDSDIWRSTDGGQTWASQVSTIPGGLIQSMTALDANTVLVGGANVVFQTTNNGVIWFSRACAVGNVTSMDVDAATGDLLAAGITGGAGKVAVSSNGGTSWSVATNTIAGVTSNIVAVFGEAYETTSAIYATGTAAGNAGVWTRTTGAWSRIDNEFDGTNGVDALPDSGASVDGAFVAAGTGIVTAPGGPEGMVYVTDADGITRMKCASSQTTANKIAELMAAPAGATFSGAWSTPGSNTIWTIDTSTASIYTYTDTLAIIPAANVTVSNVTVTGATISWDAVANATSYKVSVVTGATPPGRATGGVHGSVTTAIVTGTTYNFVGVANTQYSFRVWALTPVSSFHMKGDTTFTTNPLAPGAPPSLIPVNGATGVSLTPSMAWAPVVGAVSYEIQYGTDPTFTTVTTATSDVAFFTITTELDYDANIYWRVRAVTATGGTSAWVSSVFTTMVEPTAPVDVTTTDPNIVVNLPSDDATPAYVWGIIAIGAVLTIAVIILIVRTRRVV